MSMLIALNLQNRIVCASDTRITITKSDGKRGNPVDNFRKTANLNKNIVFMGAGSVQTNCSLVPELIKLCDENDQIQDLLEKLSGQGLANIIIEIQKANNTYGEDASIVFVLAGMNSKEQQTFSVGPVIERINEVQDYLLQDEFFLDQAVKTQLEAMGGRFTEKGPDLSKVPNSGTITIPKTPRSEVVKYDITISQGKPSVTKVHYSPFEVCVVSPPVQFDIEFLASQAIHAVEFSTQKPKELTKILNADATGLLSRFKLLSELGKIDDVVNGGLIFTDILPDQVIWNDGKLWRQMPGYKPEKISDTKLIDRKLHIYSEAEKKYVLMKAYRDPFDTGDYQGFALA